MQPELDTQPTLHSSPPVQPTLPLSFPAHVLLFNPVSDPPPCTRVSSSNLGQWYLALHLCVAVAEYFLQNGEEILGDVYLLYSSL